MNLHAPGRESPEPRLKSTAQTSGASKPHARSTDAESGGAACDVCDTLLQAVTERLRSLASNVAFSGDLGMVQRQMLECVEALEQVRVLGAHERQRLAPMHELGSS